MPVKMRGSLISKMMECASDEPLPVSTEMTSAAGMSTTPSNTAATSDNRTDATAAGSSQRFDLVGSLETPVMGAAP